MGVFDVREIHSSSVVHDWLAWDKLPAVGVRGGCVLYEQVPGLKPQKRQLVVNVSGDSR